MLPRLWWLKVRATGKVGLKLSARLQVPHAPSKKFIVMIPEMKIGDVARPQAQTRKLPLEDRVQIITDSRAIAGKEPVSDATVRRREKRLGVVSSRTQETHMQTTDQEKRCAEGRAVCAQEWLDRIDAFEAAHERTADGLPVIDALPMDCQCQAAPETK